MEVRKNMRNSVAKPNDQISKNNDLDPYSSNTIQNFRQKWATRLTGIGTLVTVIWVLPIKIIPIKINIRIQPPYLGADLTVWIFNDCPN